MTQVGTAYIPVEGDYSRFHRDTNQALTKTKTKAKATFKELAKSAGGAALIGGGAGAALALAKSSINAASDINESLSKNKVLFGQYAAEVAKFSDDSAKSFGISKQAVLEYTGTFGNLFRAFGTSQKQSAKFSVGLTKLAADMASFNNTSIEDALEAIRSGLVGEVEPLRRFGVNLSQAALQAEAVTSGLVKAKVNTAKLKIAQETLILAQAKYNKAVKDHGKTSEEAKRALLTLQKAQGAVNKEVSGSVPQLTAEQKALAAQQLIIKQTAAAHGDFHRTSKGLANQQRILTAEFTDMKAELGAKLLPVLLSVIKALNTTIGFLEKHKTAVKVAIAAWVAYRLAAKAAIVQTRLALAAQFVGLGLKSKAAEAGAEAGGGWGRAFNKAARARLLKLLPAGLTVTVVVAFQWAVNRAIAKLLNIPATGGPVPGVGDQGAGRALNNIIHGRSPLHRDSRKGVTDPVPIPGEPGTFGIPKPGGGYIVTSRPHRRRPAHELSPPHAPSGRTFRGVTINNLNMMAPHDNDPRVWVAKVDRLALARG